MQTSVQLFPTPFTNTIRTREINVVDDELVRGIAVDHVCALVDSVTVYVVPKTLIKSVCQHVMSVCQSMQTQFQSYLPAPSRFLYMSSIAQAVNLPIQKFNNVLTAGL